MLRPSYQGANPISDIWALESLAMVAEFLPRTVADPGDDEARGQMLLAASYAGMGFGNAGVHLPHGMSYPVAGMVRDYLPPGYATGHPLVPHGVAVIVQRPGGVPLYRGLQPAAAPRGGRGARLRYGRGGGRGGG